MKLYIVTACIFLSLLVGCTAEHLSQVDQAAQIAQDVSAATDTVIRNPLVTALVPAPITTIAGYAVALLAGIAAAYQNARKKDYMQATKEIVKGVELFKADNADKKQDLNIYLDRAESVTTKEIVSTIKS
jgi:hypothetical protein